MIYLYCNQFEPKAYAVCWRSVFSFEKVYFLFRVYLTEIRLVFAFIS